MSFELKFWGVRGSIPCPGPSHAKYGGNTSCLEVSIDGERFILDGGTGIRDLGHWMLKEDLRHATILLSHTHWDHVQGLPFFSPAFHKDRSIHVMAGHLNDAGGIAKIFAGQMKQPYAPVPVERMGSDLSFEDFHAGDDLKLGSRGTVTVRTAPLNHPNGATGYRFEHGGRSLCYVTDTEHVPGKPDETILGLIEGSDLLIYDCTYTDEEFEGKVGWGHSTWQEGVRLARAAGVGKLAIFHHDPDHDDRFMDRVAEEAREMWAGTFVARETMHLDIDRLAEQVD